MQRLIATAVLIFGLLAAGTAWAGDIARAVLTTVGVGAVVKATAEPADKFINSAMQNRRMPVGTATKVVPALSVGRKGYIGAIQVAGAKTLVDKAHAVAQVETEFDHGRYRIKLLIPTESSNPTQFKRIAGLGVTALVDVGLSRNAYTAPSTRSLDAGTVLIAAGIGLAVNQFGTQINSFIDKVAGTNGGTPLGETKVVPYLSFGEKAYIGAMQVAGPSWAVRKVKAVWQYEDLFDAGRLRVRALVPTTSLNPLQMKRVAGVGCTAVIDTVVAREMEHNKYRDRYRYHEYYPVFVGDEPRYARPPGWDRGRKTGWGAHGNPYLPPGQAKRRPAPRVIREVPLNEAAKIKLGEQILGTDQDKEKEPLPPLKPKGKANGKVK